MLEWLPAGADFFSKGNTTLMAKDKKPSNPKLMAPRGPMVFPKLNAADTKFKAEGAFGTKVRYNLDNADVQAFIAKLQPMHDAAVARGQELFTALPLKSRKQLEAKGIKAAVTNPLYTELFDEETEQATGQIEFNFTAPASGKAKTGKNTGKAYIRRPTVVDAKGKVVIRGTNFSWLHEIKPGPATLANTVFKKMGPAIWGGSEGKYSLEVGTFEDGTPGYFVPSSGACGLSLRLLGVQLLTLVQGGSDDLGFGEEDGGYEASDDDTQSDESADSSSDKEADDSAEDSTNENPDF